MGARNLDRVRLAIGLRSTVQSLSLVGMAAGVFAEEGIDLAIARLETTGPAGMAGLLNGDWEFAEFGAVPVAQGAVNGMDPVMLLAAEKTHALYIAGGKGIEAPDNLKGREIGVLSLAGQTGYCALQTLNAWGLAEHVSITPLTRYPDIFEAVRTGKIAAGVLTADYLFAASPEEGLGILSDLGAQFAFQGPVLATTRSFVTEHRDIVKRMVRAYGRAIHVFKTQPDLVLDVLERHLGFAGDDGVRRIYEFYRPRFSKIPYPSVNGLENVLASVQQQKSPEQRITVADIYDSTFLDELKGEGFFDSLYGVAETTD